MAGKPIPATSSKSGPSWSWSNRVAQILYLLSLAGVLTSLTLRLSHPSYNLPSTFAWVIMFGEMIMVPVSFFGGFYFFMRCDTPRYGHLVNFFTEQQAELHTDDSSVDDDDTVPDDESWSMYTRTTLTLRRSSTVNTPPRDQEKGVRGIVRGYCARVDVFVPCYKEEDEVILATIIGCLQMTKPTWVHEVVVYLLDDLGKDDRQRMCDRLGVMYICRPNRGQHAKAGNMNYALSVTCGQWVLFFDADMIPEPDALIHLSGILNAAPEEVVMVQSPQRFRDLTKCDMFGSRNIAFFDKTLCALGAYGMSCFVGTGAIFKRTALELNKIPTFGVTEDVALSLELQMRGFKTLFTRHVCAYGTSPQTFQELLTQRMRWVWGGFQTMAKYNPIFRSTVPWVAKLFWINSLLWYISAPVLILIVIALCAGILVGEPIIAHGTLIQALFVYIPASRLAWVLYMYPVSKRDAFIQVSDTLVSDFYVNHCLMFLLLWLELKWVISRGGKGISFKSSGEMMKSIGIHPDHAAVLFLMMVFGTVCLMAASVAVVRILVLPHSDNYYGYLPLSMGLALYAVKTFFTVVCWVHPLPPAKHDPKNPAHYMAMRSRRMTWIMVPPVLEHILFIAFCFYGIARVLVRVYFFW